MPSGIDRCRADDRDHDPQHPRGYRISQVRGLQGAHPVNQAKQDIAVINASIKAYMHDNKAPPDSMSRVIQPE